MDVEIVDVILPPVGSRFIAYWKYDIHQSQSHSRLGYSDSSQANTCRRFNVRDSSQPAVHREILESREGRAEPHP